MIQAPFGTTTSMWSNLPSPIAWSQPPIGVGSPPMTVQGFAPEPVASPPIGWGSPAAPVIAGPLLGPFINGMSAQALMAAVAVRRGLPQGPTNDHDVEELLYDALELLPGAGDVEVRSEGGRVTLTGNVAHKRIKHDVGELAWAVPAITDVQNTVAITGRRRSRALGREPEAQGGAQARKQA